MPISFGDISSSVDSFSPVLMSVEFRIWNGFIIFTQNTAYLLFFPSYNCLKNLCSASVYPPYEPFGLYPMGIPCTFCDVLVTYIKINVCAYVTM